MGGAKTANPPVGIYTGAQPRKQANHREVVVVSKVMKTKEDLEMKMKVDTMKVKDRKMLVARKRNVGKTDSLVQQKIKQFLDLNVGVGNKTFGGMGLEDGGRKRRLSGLLNGEQTPGKKPKGLECLESKENGEKFLGSDDQ